MNCDNCDNEWGDEDNYHTTFVVFGKTTYCEYCVERALNEMLDQ